MAVYEGGRYYNIVEKLKISLHDEWENCLSTTHNLQLDPYKDLCMMFSVRKGLVQIID